MKHVKLSEWDQSIAPALQSIESNARWLSRHALRIRQAATFLVMRPDFETNAEDCLEAAEAELTDALDRERDAIEEERKHLMAEVDTLNAGTAAMNDLQGKLNAADEAALEAFNRLVSEQNARVDAATARRLAFNQRVDAYHQRLVKEGVPVR